MSIILCLKGYDVTSYDINKTVIEKVKKGNFPFKEKKGNFFLKKALKKNIKFNSKIENSMKGSHFILTVGTSIDEFLNPKINEIKNCLDSILPVLNNKSVIILRSTVAPGISRWIKTYLASKKKKCQVAFCPERVLQGNSFDELLKLPQIISGTSKHACKVSSDIFKKISKKIIHCNLEEAEFAKLFSNAFRYIQFAISNQFFMIADQYGLDFNKIRNILSDSYPRGYSLPSAGFAAGPCLLKDTMQLSSSVQNQFSLGLEAMFVNEGLILYLQKKISDKYNIEKKNIGLLGMAFKANTDDIRSSLSYKLKKVLKLKAKNVYCTDPFVKDDKDLKDLQFTIKNSDILILCVPHTKYKKLKIPNKKLIDIWSFLK